MHDMYPIDGVPIPDIEKNFGILYCMIVNHETDTFAYSLDTFVPAFGCTGVYSMNTIIKSHSIACKACFTTTSVIMSMHFINKELCVLEIVGFTDEAVWCELTSKVINNDFWCNWKSGIDCRKDTISAFCNWDRVKAKTDRMCAPKYEDATSEIVFGVGFVNLVAVTHFFCIPIKSLVVIPKF